jgi:hypothetical protein
MFVAIGDSLQQRLQGERGAVGPAEPIHGDLADGWIGMVEEREEYPGSFATVCC